ILVDFVYDGGGLGKGGKLTLAANGKTVAEGRLERTIPIKITIAGGMDIGINGGSAIGFTYPLPVAFTGEIEKVAVALKHQPTQPKGEKVEVKAAAKA